MCLFSDIKSHPDLPLEMHLTQVKDVALSILDNKHIHFKFLGLTKENLRDIIIRTALFHDLGKATTYFENRLNTGKKGPNGEHRHAELSTILAYTPLVNYCKENNLNELIALAPLLAILYHHSKLSKELPNDAVMENRLQAFKSRFLDLPILKKMGLLNNIDSLDPIAIDCEIENFFADLADLSYEQGIEFRVLTLFIYSLLLEADKAYLAVKDKKLYQRKSIPISPDTIDKYKIEIFHNKKGHINNERDEAYEEVMNRISEFDLNKRIYSLTLPTGMGKTLLAASWAIKLRDKIKNDLGYTSQVIVALPFLSIIEQSAKEYERFLGSDDELFLKTHSLSSFEFNGYEPDTAEFFINIWKSQVIMTTLDQLLYAFFSFKPKHLMRFHNLLNSIIIIDEAQALPPHLWGPFSSFIEHITRVGNSYLLLMSATQPRFLDGTVELIPPTQNGRGAERYFEKLSRYKLVLKHDNIQAIDDFIADIKKRLPNMKADKIMIVLNTRDSAKKVYESLKDFMAGREPFFLSSYIIPAERLNRIKNIKKSKHALVITTQCIEAGVDIDMDHIIRDFGPLDSIIQVAGRCNREGEKQTKIVEIIRLYDPNARSRFCPSGEFNRMIYDELSIDATTDILNQCENNEVLENKVFDLAKQYFYQLKRKDLGKKKTQCLIDFSHHYFTDGKDNKFDIRKELRGNLKQNNLIVEKYIPEIREEIEKIFKEDIDRWERRRQLKGLASKIAMNSISVNAYKFNPEEIAEKGKGNFYYLESRYYDDAIGFNYESPPGTMII